MTKEVTIQADASQFGLGTAILQDGQPISYVSRVMTPVDRALRANRKEMSFY